MVIPSIRKGRALFVRTLPVDKTFSAHEFCKQNNLFLETINRLSDLPITTLSHKDFLLKLRTVEYYLDLKGLTSKEVLSVSGIEAIKAGCKVLVDTGDIVVDFVTSKYSDYMLLYRSSLK